MSTIKIEKISVNSPRFEDARNIRYQVFIVEQNVSMEEEYDEFETSATHFIVYIDEKPVGTCRYRATEKGYKLERFAVLKESRRKGVGSVLVNECLESIPNNTLAYLHAQLDAIPLYKKHGFVAYGDLFYECDIAHYAMKLQKN